MEYIATFFSHFGAIRFKKSCDRAGYPARVMPVPRNLSSSCGTCVKYQAEQAGIEDAVKEELEQIVSVEKDGYQLVYKAENI